MASLGDLPSSVGSSGRNPSEPNPRSTSKVQARCSQAFQGKHGIECPKIGGLLLIETKRQPTSVTDPLCEQMPKLYMRTASTAVLEQGIACSSRCACNAGRTKNNVGTRDSANVMQGASCQATLRFHSCMRDSRLAAYLRGQHRQQGEWLQKMSKTKAT